VVLGLYLADLGASPALVVVAFGISLVSGAALNVLVGYYGDRFGRRRAMIVFGLLMSAAGILLAVAPTMGFAIAGLAFGAVSPTGTEVSPFLSIEQSIVADEAREGRRTRAFAVYNLLGSLGASAGGLVGGLPAILAFPRLPTADSFRPLFLLYAVLGVLAAGISAALPKTVERPNAAEDRPLSPQSRTRIVRISALFSADAFAGGFVLQATILYWFAQSFPGSDEYLGFIFAAAGLLSAFSFLLAARLGERIGLLETMVLAHLPSSVLLILIPISGSLPLAIGLYLARQAISQMDVPTRQAFIAGIVGADERTVANAITNTARNVSQAIGPFAAGVAVQATGMLASTFFFGGGIKIAYDLAIFREFRRIKPDTI
jgi:MFS family permease